MFLNLAKNLPMKLKNKCRNCTFWQQINEDSRSKNMEPYILYFIFMYTVKIHKHVNYRYFLYNFLLVIVTKI